MLKDLESLQAVVESLLLDLASQKIMYVEISGDAFLYRDARGRAGPFIKQVQPGCFEVTNPVLFGLPTHKTTRGARVVEDVPPEYTAVVQALFTIAKRQYALKKAKDLLTLAG
ncbi:MAG: hypothetical protein WAX89_05055 [Alphaproteobacteria bacterium]